MIVVVLRFDVGRSLPKRENIHAEVGARPERVNDGNRVAYVFVPEVVEIGDAQGATVDAEHLTADFHAPHLRRVTVDVSLFQEYVATGYRLRHATVHQ
jgi:hypothetical protein